MRLVADCAYCSSFSTAHQPEVLAAEVHDALTRIIDATAPPIPINTLDQCDRADAIVRKALSVINHRRRWLTMEAEFTECKSVAERLREQQEKTMARLAEFREMRKC